MLLAFAYASACVKLLTLGADLPTAAIAATFLPSSNAALIASPTNPSAATPLKTSPCPNCSLSTPKLCNLLAKFNIIPDPGGLASKLARLIPAMDKLLVSNAMWLVTFVIDFVTELSAPLSAEFDAAWLAKVLAELDKADSAALMPELLSIAKFSAVNAVVTLCP